MSGDDEDRFRHRKFGGPGRELRHPQLVVDEWRRAVAEIENRHHRLTAFHYRLADVSR